MGNGTPSDLTSILLGFTFSILQGGFTSGQPDHLRVIHDHDFTRTDACNQLQKNIQFQVVDIAGRPAGKVNIGEKSQNVHDSCSNSTVNMSSCGSSQTSNYGNFTDGLRTGCPWNGQSNCGFAFSNTWHWCKPTWSGTTNVNLATMLYDVKRSVIKVDGEEDITNLSYKFP